MTAFIGIDPGLDGAVAIISANGTIDIADTPTVNVGKGKKVRREHVPAQMVDILRPYLHCNPVAALENVHAMPRQGVRSMFSMGKGMGLWLGILAGLGIPYDLVQPTRWKAAMMDGQGKEKDASRFRAQQLFSQLASELRRKKDHGRAEALLIAEYRRRLG